MISNETLNLQFFNLFVDKVLEKKLDINNNQSVNLFATNIINQIQMYGHVNNITFDNIDKNHELYFIFTCVSKDLKLLSAQLIQTKLFTDIISKLKQLFPLIDHCSIQDTFYNQMLNSLLNNDSLINRNAIEMREPFIYLALTSQAIILSCTQLCKTKNGMLLNNGELLTLDNCPQLYLQFLQKLETLKIKFFHLNKNQIQFIQMYTLCDPDIKMDTNLEQYKTKEIMDIVTCINSLSIQVSSIMHFKKIIEDVIKFYLEMTQTS